jgi:hypothetical protein
LGSRRDPAVTRRWETRHAVGLELAALGVAVTATGRSSDQNRRLIANFLLRSLLHASLLLTIITLAALVQGEYVAAMILAAAAVLCFLLGRSSKSPAELRAAGVLKQPAPGRTIRVVIAAYALALVVVLDATHSVLAFALTALGGMAIFMLGRRLNGMD